MTVAKLSVRQRPASGSAPLCGADVLAPHYERRSTGLAPIAFVQSSGLLGRLNMVTWQGHADVDLLRPVAGRAEYTAQIVRAYGFIAPFESACRYTPDLGRLLHLHQLSRAALLARDLLALGLTPAQVAVAPQCHSITTFRDVGEAFGWLYVVERATLLHDGLRSRLLARIPEIENACSFLVANEGRGAERWGAFGRTLEHVGARPEIANEIVAAARKAFACLEQWCRGHAEPQRHTG